MTKVLAALTISPPIHLQIHKGEIFLMQPTLFSSVC